VSRKRKLMWRDLTFRSFRVSASAPLEHMDKPRNVCGVLSVADVGQFQGICGTPGLSMGAKAELPPSSNVFCRVSFTVPPGAAGAQEENRLFGGQHGAVPKP
jgi:hypothetical protein